MRNKIKKLRNDLNWSQKEMAKYLGLDASSISRIESGKQGCAKPVQILFQVLENKIWVNNPQARIENEQKDKEDDWLPSN